MNYQQFIERIAEDVSLLVSEYGDGTQKVRIQRMDKLNESYDALMIIMGEGKMAPTLHLGRIYEEYKVSGNYPKIFKMTLEALVKGVRDMPKVDISALRNYEMVKNKLYLEVAATDHCEELLETVPHKHIEDLALVYRIDVYQGIGESGSVLITNNMLDVYGISADQLHNDAIQCAAITKPAVIKGMSHVMFELAEVEEMKEIYGIDEPLEDEMMYVATVPDKKHGASVLAYEKFFDEATEKLGGDFYIIPSSKHEIILVKDDGNDCYSEFKKMVKENEKQVEPEDRLTINVYHYDSKARVFEQGDKFETRRRRDLARAEVEKHSILKDIKDKQAATIKVTISQKTERSEHKSREGGVL